MINKTSLRKSKKGSNKGITLIALVITIIVLLILAGVSIATLTGENGILTKANTAKNQTIEAEEKEQISLAYSTVMADKLHNGQEAVVTASELKTQLNNQNARAIVETEGDKIKVTFDESGNVYMVDGRTGEITESISTDSKYNTAETVKDAITQNKLFKDTKSIKDNDEKNVTIPSKFKIASDSAETVAEGVVIEDSTGNQFVWVPVDNMENFKPIEGYSSNKLQSILTKCTEPFANGYSTEANEYSAMYDSVKNNKGFYIGRFEAGKDSSGNVVVKKGVDVYNNVPWGNAMNDIEGTNNTGGKVGAAKLAKEFATANNYQGVTTTLCYGVQWDATLQFMDSNYFANKCEESSYVRNSTGKGWYSDNYNKTDLGNTETNPNHITGKDLIYSDKPTAIANKQKNIYDMAGNVAEWTMEAYSTDCRVRRGGSSYGGGSDSPASYCGYGVPADPYDYMGFRVALYL